MDVDYTREQYDDQSWDRQLFNVKAALNTYNMTTSRALDAGPVIKLVDIVAQCEMGAPNALRRLVAVAMQNNGFRGTSQQTKNFFKSLQASYPDVLQNAEQVFDDLTLQDAPLVIENWAIAETLHRFYGLKKIKIYRSIIEKFASREPQEQDGEIALIEYMRWCITEDVARKLMNPYDDDTELVVDAWARIARQKMAPILPSIVFRATMALMPFNMTYNTTSLQDIIGNKLLKWTIGQGLAAHVLYPNVFTYRGPKDDKIILMAAIEIAIDSEATVAQVQQICPYSTSPDELFFMADIMRRALSKGRLDIAIAYGLGPDTLKLIDMDQSVASRKRYEWSNRQWPQSRYSSWLINDFLGDYEGEPRVILETMQLPQDQVKIVLQQYYD